MNIDQKYIQDKFIEYCEVDTRSYFESETVPTSVGQVELLQLLKQELIELGLSQISYSPKDAYLLGKIPATTSKKVTAIGFVAHVDTADYNSKNIKVQIHKNYDGTDIRLDKSHVLSSKQFSSLKKVIGHTLLTASGDTLLGADDKTGIAGALGMAKYLLSHPEIEHGDIWLAFGPDEEIGKGAARFDVKRFPVEFAYTLDNGDIGDIAYETFNAASATVTFAGTVVHPGEAYGLMVNAGLMANEFIAALPKDFVPEKSKGYDGFYLVTDFSGNVDQAMVNLIIRSFDTKDFLARKQFLKNLANKIDAKYGKGRVKIEMRDQYKSPGDLIKQNPYVVNLVHHAYKQLNITAKHIPFRGGTDGDFISEKGIPTPNLFNGGANFHGPYEYVTIENMAKLSEVLVEISKLHVHLNDCRDETPLKR
ncbi:peptidase T [Lactobacillus mulieris]|uniref:Peptidase T n=1 Tax=Lactobacillus mulieris TaxID=2508708 RepID=A0AAP3GWD4_9LACO|nr:MULTISPECIES: peptidase T [Lactobacillus]EEU21044.1 peptidase T [Lactobacillus jensenii 27-2-CHN]EEX23291.1 peptidase T [Lactobacillus jensenii 115-3-CHN]EFH30397.1 peptidase T [Lactobacillus jensenii JV-V16]KAA9245164.1 peptidase T [Lactobacillus jensenii]KAA9367727.1 peptidase T [Lactobacillus jensenii]